MFDFWPDYSLYQGLTGYGRYWLCRMNDPQAAGRAMEMLLRILDLIERNFAGIKEKDRSDVFCFLYDLGKSMTYADRVTRLIEKCLQWQYFSPAETEKLFPRLGDSAIGNIVRMYLCHYYLGTPVMVIADNIAGLKMERPRQGIIPVCNPCHG